VCVRGTTQFIECVAGEFCKGRWPHHAERGKDIHRTSANNMSGNPSKMQRLVVNEHNHFFHGCSEVSWDCVQICCLLRSSYCHNKFGTASQQSNNALFLRETTNWTYVDKVVSNTSSMSSNHQVIAHDLIFSFRTSQCSSTNTLLQSLFFSHHESLTVPIFKAVKTKKWIHNHENFGMK
jgi:hypothetical protein